MKASDYIRLFRKDLVADRYFGECLREIELQEKHLAEYRRISLAMAADLAKAAGHNNHHEILKRYELATEKEHGPVVAVGMRAKIAPSDEAVIANLKARYPGPWYSGVGAIYNQPPERKGCRVNDQVISITTKNVVDESPYELAVDFQQAIAALFNAIEIEEKKEESLD